MKLTLITPALVAVLGLALASSSIQAQTTAAAPAATAPAKAKKAKTPYSGSITAVSADSITVQGAKTLTLAIAPTTTYKGGKTITDFAVGDKVTGSYTKDAAGALTAASVHKKVAKAAATPAAQ